MPKRFVLNVSRLLAHLHLQVYVFFFVFVFSLSAFHSIFCQSNSGLYKELDRKMLPNKKKSAKPVK